MHTRFRPDHQLTARMLVTVFLLALVYAAFIAALLVLIRSVFVVVLIAGGLLFLQYWFSDWIALYAMRARIVSPEQAPRLHGIVERLCATTDMPKPQVAIADMEIPNAFATGRSNRRAVL